LKNVLFISASEFSQATGGAEYQIKLIIEYLKNQFNISFLFYDNGNKLEKVDGINYYTIKKNSLLRKLFGKYFILDFLKVIKVIKITNPAIIYLRSGFAWLGIIGLIKYKYSFKLIFHVAHDEDLTRNRLKDLKIKSLFSYIDKYFSQIGIRKSDYIICQTIKQFSLLEQNFNMNNAVIIRNAHPRPICEIKKSEDLKIVWIANAKRWKKPELFIKLANALNETNAEFLMIGEIPENSWGIELKKEISKSSNIIYYGKLSLSETNNILCNSHIFVNTSLFEGFPNTFIQAWMRKVPVVSLYVDPDDVIKKNGIGFHSRTFEQMVDDVKLLIHDNTLRKTMGEKAQKYAFDKHSLNNFANLLELVSNG
jgi:glycosyltransferase involved in cell wall biosynthesis